MLVERRLPELRHERVALILPARRLHDLYRLHRRRRRRVIRQEVQMLLMARPHWRRSRSRQNVVVNFLSPVHADGDKSRRRLFVAGDFCERAIESRSLDDDTELSGIAVLRADLGYSRRGNFKPGNFGSREFQGRGLV